VNLSLFHCCIFVTVQTLDEDGDGSVTLEDFMLKYFPEVSEHSCLMPGGQAHISKSPLPHDIFGWQLDANARVLPQVSELPKPSLPVGCFSGSSSAEEPAAPVASGMFQLATPVAGDAYPVVDPDMSILEYADIFEKKFRDGLFSADNMQFMEFVITESTGVLATASDKDYHPYAELHVDLGGARLVHGHAQGRDQVHARPRKGAGRRPVVL
jgi:hypothetical protein